jgi:Skp family chaperone for outer membrane proteins
MNFIKHCSLNRLVLGLPFLMVGTVTPRNAAAADDVKIGIIDLQGAVNKSKKGEQAKADLTKKFERMKQELQAEDAELQKMQAELERQGQPCSVMKPSMKNRNHQRQGP